MTGEANKRLLEACQMAYRKHVADDGSIGWDELSEVLSSTLAEVMGDKEFVKWTEKVGLSGKPIVE